MSRKAVLATVALATMGFATAATAADAPARRAKVVAAPVVVVSEWADWRTRYCADWGPHDFGSLSGALPRYERNAFPGWHGECRIWGPYSASSSAYW